jgi:hypothetical protein
VKGFVIAEIPPCERKVRVKGSMIARIPSWKRKNSCERLLDIQSSIVRRKEFVKGLRDSQRLCESLKSHR